MTQQNNEFVKWFDKQLDNENAFTSDEPICKQSWKAATAESDKIVAELKSHINVLREELETLRTSTRKGK